MDTNKAKLTLDQPVIYQIEVPGLIVANWTDWVSGLTSTTRENNDGQPITVLTGMMDQAALQGLLRRLYGMGLPLLAVRQTT